GLRLVGNDQVDVEVDGVAESLAPQAGAVGIIEGDEAGLRLAVLAVTVLALEGRGETQIFKCRSFDYAPCGRFAQDDRRALFSAADDFVQDLAGFAVADLRSVDDAGAVFGGDGDAVD